MTMLSSVIVDEILRMANRLAGVAVETMPFLRLATVKAIKFLFVTTLALGIVGAHSSAMAANPKHGLTIITPGYQLGGGYLPRWASEMANAIQARIGTDSPLALIPIYRARYDKQSWSTTADDQIQLESGSCQDSTASIDITSAGGAIILLDWAAASNESIEYPAQDVADRFFDCLFGRGHKGHNLAEVPIHLIGHSRGASLNSRLAYRLAEHGILVEQVTTLDPHPVRPWHVPSGADWIPETFLNVIFADNYYQLDNFPEGMELAGAFNQNLTFVVTGLGPAPHQHVHTYYHGTIDYLETIVDEDPILGTWYQATIARDSTGYNFSRYTNSLVTRPTSGVNQFVANAGGTGSRVSVNSAFQFWPNVGFDQRDTYQTRVTVGQTVNIPYYYADRNSQQIITFFTDSDTNPFNGTGANIGSVTQNSRPAGSIGATMFSWSPTAADVGTPYYIGVKTTNTRTDQMRVRYDYYLKQITVESAPVSPPTITSILPPTLPASSSPQLITITGTNFKLAGDPNASSLIFYDPANNAYPRTPINVTETSMQYNLTVGSATGAWKVKVLNGGVESLPFTFTVPSSGVQLTGLSISGPATIAENSNGQFTATAYFSDDSSSTVTSSASWSENSGVTTISSGLLSAGSVSSNTDVNVSASFTSGGITKSSATNTTIVNGGSGGGSQQTNVIVNGDFEAGDAPWGTPYGYADVVNLSYPHNGSWYGYIGNANNASGAIAQFFPIPSSATAAMLKFYIDVVTFETTTTQKFDKLKIDLATGSDQFVGTIAEFSNLDKGDNVDGTYALKSYDIMSLLNTYKGQSLYLIFSGTTDYADSTIFRIDDVSLEITTPSSIALTGLSISGPSSLLEGHLGAYSAQAIFSDGTTQTVSPNSWSENSSVTSITSNGYLTAPSVNSGTSVTVTASYTFSGVTTQATKIVDILDTNPAKTFSFLVIGGPSSMNENSTGQFTATAIFADGTSELVAPSWSENSTVTSTSTGGLLTAGNVVSDTTVTVSASYTTGGITRNASQDVLIINTPTPPTLTSLAISGRSSVNENSTEQYSATAFFSDSSSQTVNPIWSENSAETTISNFGLLSAGEVVSDTSVTVSANYTIGGVTQNATKNVTIVNAQLPSAPVITSADTASGTVNQSFSYPITATNSPTSYGASGLPAWLSVNQSTGLISGTPTATGTVTVTVTATNAGGMYSKTVAITVTATPAAGIGRVDIAAGAIHTCALTTAGGAKCWGANGYGELGDNTTTERHTPVDVSGLTSGVAAVAAGGSSSISGHTCALTTAGGVKCWGSNNSGELGDTTNTNRATPVDVSGLTSGVVAITAGGSHTCALTTAGGVKCWGWNSYGQLGDTTTTERHTPVDVSGLTSGVAAITAGGGHTCALTTAGGVKCWGSNNSGELGDTTNTNRATPVDVSGLTSGVVAITAGGSHTCALTTAGGVKCWGWDYFGQLGDTTTTDRATPVDVSGLTSGVAAITAGGGHTCALTTAGGVKCWGWNGYGELGDTTNTNRATPVDVSGLTSGVAAITAGTYHTCALTTAGGVKCWGYNTQGGLGDGTTTWRATPVYVSGFAGSIATFPLTVATSGSGSGTITSSPAGINCGTTCGASFTSGSSVTLVATSAVGSTFAGWGGGACTNANGTCTVSMTMAQNVVATFVISAATTSTTSTTTSTTTTTLGSTTTTTLIGSSATLYFVAGWNLIGNGRSDPIVVSSVFGDQAKVITVWKWVASNSAWAFYTPTLSDGGAAYAASKGYAPLTSIAGGEGFWVNAKAAFSAALSGSPVATGDFKDSSTPPTPPNALPAGWSLIAVGDSPTPREFVNTIAATPPAAGVSAATSITTLWAWDNAQSAWYFYAPALDNSGGLANYISSKNYLDFTTANKTLGPGVGFWVNKP